MKDEARTYTEQRTNGVVVETTLIDADVAEEREIRWAVKKNGTILFNKALTGRYNGRVAKQITREQEEVARNASRE